MIELLVALQEAQRGWKRDWVFLGFLAVAVAFLVPAGVRRLRLAQAVSRASECLASGDAACAAPQVEVARGIDPEAPRVALASLDLSVFPRRDRRGGGEDACVRSESLAGAGGTR